MQLPPLPEGFALRALPSAADLASLLGLPAEFAEPAPRDPRSAFPDLPGGEGAALARLHDYVTRRQLVLQYSRTRNQLLGEGFSSKFSAWLSTGALSARQVWESLREAERLHGPGEGIAALQLEMLWRDYFHLLSMSVGRRLFWWKGLRGQVPRPIEPNKQLFEAWRTGRTGNKFVDANMRELMATGFMSNRGRQNVASFLIFDLQQDWRWGAAWFEHCLIDHDPASNWGNWKYIAGTGTDVRDTSFDVAKQAQHYDPKGRFTKTWLED